MQYSLQKMHSWEEFRYVYFTIWVIQLTYCNIPFGRSHVTRVKSRDTLAVVYLMSILITDEKKKKDKKSRQLLL